MDSKINEWLQDYKPINDIDVIEEIHSERLTNNVKNLALQRTGFEELPLKYTTDKGWYRQYQYMLFLKSESEVDKQRLDNLDWLDDFSDWLIDQNKIKNYPQLGDNKIIKNVSCANALTYQESEDGAISIYSLQLYFNIRKEN